MMGMIYSFWVRARKSFESSFPTDVRNQTRRELGIGPKVTLYYYVWFSFAAVRMMNGIMCTCVSDKLSNLPKIR